MPKKESFWTHFPEITDQFRTKEEDELAQRINVLYEDMKNSINGDDSSVHADIAGGCHLLQHAIIKTQKKRMNERS